MESQGFLGRSLDGQCLRKKGQLLSWNGASTLLIRLLESLPISFRLFICSEYVQTFISWPAFFYFSLLHLMTIFFFLFLLFPCSMWSIYFCYFLYGFLLWPVRQTPTLLFVCQKFFLRSLVYSLYNNIFKVRWAW